MISNPYKREGTTAAHLKKVSADVDPIDYAFFKRKFPNGCTGITDKLISTLYKKFIDELRRLDSDPSVPFDICFYSDSPGYTLLDSVLEGVQFGQHARRESGPDVSGGASGIHQEVRVDAEQCAVAQGSDQVGRSVARRDKKAKVRGTEKG